MGSTPGLPQPELTGDRRALFEALMRRSARIAQIYSAGVLILSDTANPERFVFSAHSFRELMEKLPEIVDVSTPAHREKLTVKFSGLEQVYDTAVRNTKLRRPDWCGEVDPPAARLLQAVDEIIAWRREHMPRRRAEVASTMRALDGPGRVLPEDLARVAVDEWMELKDYFVTIAHHGVSHVDRPQFENRIRQLDAVLLRKLNPQTFAEFDVIDDIVREGEA